MKFVSLTVMILSLALSGYAQHNKETRAVKELGDIMTENSAVGLAVAVVKEGRIIWVNSSGLKNIEQKILLDTNDLFRIASISKSFTATAAMQLVDKGLISLDDDVSDLIGFRLRNPNFPDKPVSLKMLLSHTAGLRDALGYFNLDVINPGKNPDHAKAWHNYPPGGGYEYCNMGFNLTGTILEKISGVRFDNYIRENIIKPLSLNGDYNIDSLDNTLFTTLYGVDSAGNFVPQPAAYKSRAKDIDSGYVAGYSTPLFSPTGGMKISARDLARYMIMHMNSGTAEGKQIISPESSAMMQTPVVEVDENNSYCLALTKTRNLIPGELMTGHTGSAYGLYSAMFFEPQKKFGFVMITNGCKSPDVEGFTKIQADVIRALYKIFITSR